ncbi:MAG TPA: transposase, partial [Cyclobacteriaceae bacterium]|nr:transposase [Cyclobacteriaceae bacterium]
MTEERGYELLKENAELKSELLMIKQEMTQLRRMIFGSKSERFVPAQNPDQLSLDITPEEPSEVTAIPQKKKIEAYDRKVPSDQKIHPVRQGFPEHLP